MSGGQRGGPLQGVRVVELTKVWAGPYAGKLLGFLGAEVIRIESRGSLDVTRTFGVADTNKAPGFMAVNPGKLSATIDMKTEKGISLILDLLGNADIVIENLRPGAIGRLGLGYEAVKAINPKIVYVAMGMYGEDGPLAYQTGYAPCFAALGGVSALVGYEGQSPAGMNVRYADSTFGAAAAYAAIVALVHARKTGVGQFIDVSAVECMTTMVGDAVMEFSLNGVERKCQGNRHPEMSPHGVFPCLDGAWLSLAIATDQEWRTLAHLMGRPDLADDVRFASLATRRANETALEIVITDWTRMQSAEQAAQLLQDNRLAAAKSQASVDLVGDAHLWARGLYTMVRDASGDERAIVGPSWRMTEAASIERGAPNLGEHTDYVLGEILGLSEAERRALAESGVTH